MVGVDLRIVGVAVMREMHVAERLVLMQQERSADIADEVVEPEPFRLLAGDVAVAGLVQRRLVGIEDEGIQNESEPERDGARRRQGNDEAEGGNDAGAKQHGRPGHHALVGLH